MAEIRTVKTDQLETGMIVSGDIANDQGVVVLFNNFILDEKAISNLPGQGISAVRIIFEAHSSTEERQAEVKQQYISTCWVG